MTIITIIIILILLGVVLWAADRYLPLDQPFKGGICFLIVLAGVYFAARAAGVL